MKYLKDLTLAKIVNLWNVSTIANVAVEIMKGYVEK